MGSAVPAQTHAQNEGVRLLPGTALAPPLLAAPREVRTGLRKEIGSSRMRLDIGTLIDLAGLSPDAGWDLRIGADIFAYGLTTSSSGLRLQIDAVDGFFGGHVSAHRSYGPTTVLTRLRILHHSAHFVDGHYDLDQGEWKGGIEPTPYTRDAGELLLLFGHFWGDFRLEVYGGVEYATFMRPDEMARWSYLGGIQSRMLLLESLLGAPCSGYLAYHLGVDGVPVYEFSHTIQGGVKIGAWEGRGIRLYGEFTAGLEPYGQYYTVRREHWGLGFALDIW
jgi:hypothetical protein